MARPNISLRNVVRRLMVASLALLSCPLTACDMTKFAADSTVDVMKQAAPAVQREYDVKLARAAIEGNLGLMTGLLEVTPENDDLLRLATEAYSSYGTAFIEPELWAYDEYDDEAEVIRARLKDIQQRAQGFARARLKLHARALHDALDGPVPEVERLVNEVSDDEALDAVFWVAQTWGQTIQADLEDIEAVAGLPTVKALMQRVRDVDPWKAYGMPTLFFAVSNSVISDEMGGDLEGAKKDFEAVIAHNDDNFLMARFFYGRFYCATKLDRACFEAQLTKVAEADPATMPERRLMNTLARDWARIWLTKADTIF